MEKTQDTRLTRRQQDLVALLEASPSSLSYRELMSALNFTKESSVASLIDRTRKAGVPIAQGLVVDNGRLIVVFHTSPEVIENEQRGTRADLKGFIRSLGQKPQSAEELAAAFDCEVKDIRSMLSLARQKLAEGGEFELIAERIDEPGLGRCRRYRVVPRHVVPKQIAAE